MGHSEGGAGVSTRLLCMGHSAGGATGALCIGHSAGGWAEVSIEEWDIGSSEMPWLTSPPIPALVMTLAVFWAAEMVLPIADNVKFVILRR